MRVTAEIAILSLLLATPIGYALALVRTSSHRHLRWVAMVYVEVFRGTSALVQLFWAFYVLPFFGFSFSPFITGVVVLGLNEGSYLSEFIRSGLSSVPRQQREASVVLGLPSWYVWSRVEFPQALPVIIPPYTSVTINMFKFTSLLSLITVNELAARAGAMRTETGQTALAYGSVLVLYYLISITIALSFGRFERVASRWAGRPQAVGGGRSSAIPQWARVGK